MNALNRIAKKNQEDATSVEQVILIHWSNNPKLAEKAAKELEALNERVKELEGLIFRNLDPFDITVEDEKALKEIQKRWSRR